MTEQIALAVEVRGPWYVAAVKPGKEDTVERHLDRQGFRSFSPRRLKTVRHARRVMERRVPLFPGYVFVTFDTARCGWRAVNGTVGVRSLVMSGGRPSTVPSGVVEAFIRSTNTFGVVDIGADLRAGQRVQILTGPFADLIGTIDRLDANGRVRVLLNLLNGESPVLMGRDAVWPAA
ncbi:MAG: transcription antiterminator NusG [Parvibaculum sp.]|nr:transcription antiterminator NusG [Parvibaculum sp.]